MGGQAEVEQVVKGMSLTLSPSPARGLRRLPPVMLSYTNLNSPCLDGDNRIIDWQFSVTEDISISVIGWFD